jgi:hypothetical protein
MPDNPSGFDQPLNATPLEPRLQTVSWLVWNDIFERLLPD